MLWTFSVHTAIYIKKGSLINVICYERVCYERVCYEPGLLWKWSVFNRSVMSGSAVNVVCFEWSVMNSLFWTYSTPSKCFTTRFLQEATQHQNSWPPRSCKKLSPCTKSFSKVYLPVAPDGVLTCGKSKFALKYSNGKELPSDFSHFYCHRVVLSTNKILKVFSTSADGS